jgi:pimeloyl-ACP methyl ester carboxylesterase
LICGGGLHDRDVTYKGHRYFLVLADYLTRKGIAVLRADKRGFGKSNGNFWTATTIEFAADVEAGIAYLKTRAEIDPLRIGLIGHSEGGVVAPMVAARNASVAFIVMMAGSGLPGDQIAAAQDEQSMQPKLAGKFREVYALLKTQLADAELRNQLREKLAGAVPESQLNGYIEWLMSPSFRRYIQYDPAITFNKIKVPVLAIIGEKDLQVPPKPNLLAIRKALEAAGNKSFEVCELPGLNHLFQTAPTGESSEYGEIAETISPLALEKIAVWIRKYSHKGFLSAR